MPVSEVSPAGVQRIRYLNGGFDAIYHPAKDLSRIRSAASGATAVARVPVVVRRSLPAVRVAARLSSKLRYAKITPQSLIAGLLLDAALQKILEEEGGYEYDPVQRNFFSNSPNLLVFKGNIKTEDGQGPELAFIGFPAKYGSVDDLIKNPYYAGRIDELCRAAVEKVIAANPLYEGSKYSGYNSSTCNVESKSRGSLWAVMLTIRANTDKRPISDSELQQVLTKYIENHPNPEKVLEAAEMPESAWGEPKVLITEETIINSEPYTDSRDGKAKQSQFRLWPCGGETCASETIKERPDLKPNSPEAPAVTPGGNAGTGSGGQSGNQSGNGDKDQTEQQKPFDLCREHPEIMACDQQPEPEDADLTIPKETVNLEFKPENVFNTDAACPKGEEFEAFGGRFSISLEPACAAARKIRPFIIAGAWLVAAFFVVRVVRQEV